MVCDNPCDIGCGLVLLAYMGWDGDKIMNIMEKLLNHIDDMESALLTGDEEVEITTDEWEACKEEMVAKGYMTRKQLKDKTPEGFRIYGRKLRLSRKEKI